MIGNYLRNAGAEISAQIEIVAMHFDSQGDRSIEFDEIQKILTEISNFSTNFFTALFSLKSSLKSLLKGALSVSGELECPIKREPSFPLLSTSISSNFFSKLNFFKKSQWKTCTMDSSGSQGHGPWIRDFKPLSTQRETALLFDSYACQVRKVHRYTLTEDVVANDVRGYRGEDDNMRMVRAGAGVVCVRLDENCLLVCDNQDTNICSKIHTKITSHKIADFHIIESGFILIITTKGHFYNFKAEPESINFSIEEENLKPICNNLEFVKSTQLSSDGVLMISIFDSYKLITRLIAFEYIPDSPFVWMQRMANIDIAPEPIYGPKANNCYINHIVFQEESISRMIVIASCLQARRSIFSYILDHPTKGTWSFQEFEAPIPITDGIKDTNLKRRLSV